MREIAIVFTVMAALSAQPVEISGGRMRTHIKFLASDLLEGRGTGSRGGQLASHYIATELALSGTRAAGNHGTYFQKVPLLGVETRPTATLSAQGSGKSAMFRWLDDFVGSSHLGQSNVSLDGEVVFAGFGISAPEYGWDDFKGVDVAGKILLVFTNEPASSDSNFFAGPALTYYGRWTYKFEEATRRGARAVLIIHTTPSAGYGYDVVRSSWGKEDFQLAGSQAGGLAFAGWLSRQAAERLLALAGKNVEQLLAASETRDFQALPLGIHLRGTLPTRVRSLESENVIGIIPGSDPNIKDQVVVFTAHWDHLGIGATVNGDRIYNGAVDNASGCAAVLELARAWSKLDPKPRRSALFLFTTAEEEGLLGSQYYTEHPSTPLGQTAADLNFDGLLPFGRTGNVSLTGADRTTLWPLVQQAARSLQFNITPEGHPEQGHYYRSDHFSFAHAGVPAFSVQSGDQLVGKPPAYGVQLAEEYGRLHYHQPSDEYHDNWDMAGMEAVVQLGLKIGIDVANQDQLPSWLPGDEFLAAREASWAKPEVK